eukprot:gene15216-biopygen4197
MLDVTGEIVSNRMKLKSTISCLQLHTGESAASFVARHVSANLQAIGQRYRLRGSTKMSSLDFGDHVCNGSRIIAAAVKPLLSFFSRRSAPRAYGEAPSSGAGCSEQVGWRS